MMKKIFALILVLIIFPSCAEKITEEDIIGGKWIATGGYQDGEAVGEPNCYPFSEGIEFTNKDTVHVDRYDRDFEYWLYQNDNRFEIMFNDISGSGIYSYEISMLGENEIGISGKGDFRSEESCYFERND